MKVFTIDLYEYLGKERGDNKGGFLTCQLHENTKEVDENRKYPSMLVFPGGGYATCSDREAEPIGEAYYANGFNSFVLRYSCYPSQFPTQLIEAAMAMAYIRRNAEELNVDGKHVATVGFSAGGHLCGSVSTMYGYPEVEAAGFTAEEVRPDASVLSYAVISSEYSNGGTFNYLCDRRPEVLERTSIDKLVTPNTPPMFIWCTADDGCVNSMNSLLLATAARQTRSHSTCIYMKRVSMGFLFATEAFTRFQ